MKLKPNHPLAAVAIGCLVFFGGVRGASAGCVPPEVSFSPSTARPGDALDIRGRYWDDICDDTGSDGGGCTFDEDDGPDSRPTQDIRISLKRLGTNGARRLGEVDADKSTRFAFKAELPTDLEPGRYRVIADNIKSEEVLIVENGK